MIPGKSILCYTEVSDFTGIQGIGNDPIYKRYGSVRSVLAQAIPEQHRSFLAEPEYVPAEDQINWYTENWGENEIPVRFRDLQGQEKENARRLVQNALSSYQKAQETASPDVAKVLAAATHFVNEDFIFIIGNRPVLAVWGMTPDMVQHRGGGTIIHSVDFVNSYPVVFDAGEHGVLANPLERTMRRKEGVTMSARDIPVLNASEGFEFAGWSPDPVGMEIRSPMTFTAMYRTVDTPPPPPPPPPPPTPKMTFREWFFHHGGLKGLLWFLLLLALLLLLLYLQNRQCSMCGWFRRNPGTAIGGRIGSVPSTPIDAGDLGVGIDPGIGDGDYHVGIFPPDPGVSPIENPDDPYNSPDIIPNVVNLFFYADDANLTAFARDFRHYYPDNTNYLLDYDDYVKRVSVKFPANERTRVKTVLSDSLGRSWDFILVDEVAIAMDDRSSWTVSASSGAYEGWHRDAIHLQDAWTRTKGSQDIIVAVVDDGFDVEHPLLAGKIVSPYNVYTRSSTLSFGSGHGTHVSGLAVGSVREDGKVSGVAPECKLMPVQVFQGEYSTLSAMISGIAYAIHKGASVVNASMGASYRYYSHLPEDTQLQISQQRGLEEQAVWEKVLKMADDKKVILVFSAGNDNVLATLCPQNRPDGIISVSAADSRRGKASFSDFGKGTTVAAPGVSIVSSMPGGSYGSMDGTSQAAPIVAGTVALMKSLNKELTSSQVISILQDSGDRVENHNSGPFVRTDKAVERVASSY